MNRPTCPKCGKQLIEPYGPPSSKILIAGEFPGIEEIKRGIPFVGKTGEILKAECMLVGINLMACRMTNLWLHAKDEEGCDVDWHIQQFIKEMKDRKYILMMGSDLTEVFFQKSVMDLTGLEVKSRMFPKHKIVASVNPAFALHGPVGELRLAMRKFAEVVK